jgi:co-chaperonin GroES (HSP10)
MPPMRMKHAVDPAKEIIEAAGNLDDIELFNIQVLIGIYVRPNKTASGILLTDKTVDEDNYQGKVGLVLKIGPDAFVDPDGKWFGGKKINVGDWVVFRPSDGWSVSVNGKSCRIMNDTLIKGRIKEPDMIW